MKLFLSSIEKKEFENSENILIERIAYIPAPKSSIIHGIGMMHLFDKVDYRWVYGNVYDYIIFMKNKGRRYADYKDNSKNINSGGNWFDCIGTENIWGSLNREIVLGKKNIVKFKIIEQSIKELRLTNDNKYLNIVIIMMLEKI